MCRKAPLRLPFPFCSIWTEILDFGGLQARDERQTRRAELHAVGELVAPALDEDPELAAASLDGGVVAALGNADHGLHLQLVFAFGNVV